MFAINDYVVTRSNGICQIKEIDSSSSGEETYFTLQPYCTSQIVIRVPSESGEIVRKISTREEALEIVDRMPYIPTIQIPRKNIRDQVYKSVMDQCEALEWVKMIKTVYQRKKEKALTEGESDLAETARKYLLSELSLALDIPYDEVEPFIQKSIKDNF